MIIIPARLASSRFPNKILCDIGGVPMFIKSAQNAQAIDEVVLARTIPLKHTISQSSIR